MRTDALTVHSDDVGEPVGEFFGTSVRTLCALDVELRTIDDIQQRARVSTGSAPIELLSGEITKDNIIRRETTLEVRESA
jgi:hypothetical protein